ncbi:MAG: hypothetical protein KDB35_23920 [Acidimicrobiales bacterium]|nr:hypothetical protein [Acidimicrobiales bacterium]
MTSGGITEAERLELALELCAEPEVPEVLPVALPADLVAATSFRVETARVVDRSRPWVATDGVQGLGIGQKITAGTETGELALRVYVEAKLPKGSCHAPVPSTVALPDLGQVHTDVVEIGPIRPESFRERVRPVLPGCSVGHPDISAGTLGAVVTYQGKPGHILSNSHVLAASGMATVGDAVLQPARDDGGVVGKDRIGSLAAFVPFVHTDEGFPNRVDAAVASVRKAAGPDPVIRLVGRPPAGVTTRVRRGMHVHKVGRTTDHTFGVIQDVNLRIALNYPGGRVGFRDQVLCSRYTDGGDSGSLVLSSSDRAVGLHFAGSPSASVFNRIAHVLADLDVALVTGG